MEMADDWLHLRHKPRPDGGDELVDSFNCLAALFPEPPDTLTSACHHAIIQSYLDRAREAGVHGPALCQMMAIAGSISALAELAKAMPMCQWGTGPCIATSAYNNLAPLKWLRGQSPPCPMDPMACTIWAAMAGHKQILIWLLAHGTSTECPAWRTQRVWQMVVSQPLLAATKVEWPGFEMDKACYLAGHHGRHRTLQWFQAVQPACAADSMACCGAAAAVEGLPPEEPGAPLGLGGRCHVCCPAQWCLRTPGSMGWGGDMLETGAPWHD